jgi:L-threonylcarbamoyladenylate synthase
VTEPTIDPRERDQAIEHLRQGGVVAIATETYFTLCADARRTSAVEAVFALKDRETPRAAAILIPDFDCWAPFVRTIPPLARRLAEAFWPGPLTIALPAADGAHAALKWRGKIACRVPGRSPALDLVRAFGSALTATSANPTGAPSALTHDDVRAYFEGRASLMIVGAAAPGGMPSTVVEIDDTAMKIVRPGAVPASVVEAAAA